MNAYNVRRTNVSPSGLEEYREVFPQLEYENPRIYTNNSRYKNLRQIHDEENNRLYHETWVQKFVDKSADDSYFTVTITEKDRLDMVSQYYYNTPKYWWIIAIANYIIDPFDIPVGTVLRIPPSLSVFNKGGLLTGD